MKLPEGVKTWIKRAGEESEARIARSWKTSVLGLAILGLSSGLLYLSVVNQATWLLTVLLALWAVGYKE